MCLKHMDYMLKVCGDYADCLGSIVDMIRGGGGEEESIHPLYDCENIHTDQDIHMNSKTNGTWT